MSHRIHPQARTTPLPCQEIRDSPLSNRKLAVVYGNRKMPQNFDRFCGAFSMDIFKQMQKRFEI